MSDKRRLGASKVNEIARKLLAEKLVDDFYEGCCCLHCLSAFFPLTLSPGIHDSFLRK